MLSLLALLTLCGSSASATLTGDNGINYHLNVAAIRRHILSSNYDGAEDAEKLLTIIPPASNRSAESYIIEGENQTYSLAGTLVYVGVRIFNIASVDITNNEIKLKVWFRLQWQDDRLAWDPAQFGGVRLIQMRANGLTDAELSEIWVPDIIPYNSRDGISSTLEPAIASVDSTGQVYWSRPGVLDVICAFSGLNNFPYDTLRCPIDIGGWLVPPAQQGIALWGDGIEILPKEGTERSAVNTYSEWELQGATAEIVYNYYPSCARQRPRARDGQSARTRAIR